MQPTSATAIGFSSDTRSYMTVGEEEASSRADDGLEGSGFKWAPASFCRLAPVLDGDAPGNGAPELSESSRVTAHKPETVVNLGACIFTHTSTYPNRGRWLVVDMVLRSWWCGMDGARTPTPMPMPTLVLDRAPALYCVLTSTITAVGQQAKSPPTEIQSPKARRLGAALPGDEA